MAARKSLHLDVVGTVPADDLRVDGSDLHLVVLGQGAPQNIRLPEAGELTIGRDSSAQVRIEDPRVSSRHALLVRGADGVTLQDLGSRNGLRLGDRPLGSEPVAFMPGNTAILGSTMLMLQVLPRLVGERRNSESHSGEGLVVSDQAMNRVYDEAKRAAKSKVSVLITGETGVGKDRLARWIHDQSSRATNPFVEVDLTEIHPNLMESELFGHAKGAFNDAESRKGLFARGEGGTVLLNEIGDLPLSLQPKLLRVLDKRTLRRLGEDTERSLDVRWIAATNKDLTRLVREERFREDLFYRLAVVVLALPPLRDRPSEIEPLARFFLRQCGEENGRSGLNLSAAAVASLKSQRWPGNVRQLRNVIERAVVLSPGNELEPEDLLESLSESATASEATLDAQPNMRERILAALGRNGWNREATADELGIKRTALWQWIEEAQYPTTPQERLAVVTVLKSTAKI